MKGLSFLLAIHILKSDKRDESLHLASSIEMQSKKKSFFFCLEVKYVIFKIK